MPLENCQMSGSQQEIWVFHILGFLCPAYLNIIEKITAVIRSTVYSTGTEYGTVVLVLVLYVLSEYIHTVNEGLQYIPGTYPSTNFESKKGGWNWWQQKWIITPLLSSPVPPQGSQIWASDRIRQSIHHISGAPSLLLTSLIRQVAPSVLNCLENPPT